MIADTASGKTQSRKLDGVRSTDCMTRISDTRHKFSIGDLGRDYKNPIKTRSVVGRDPIADAGFGEDDLRVFRVGLDLLANLADIDAQILGIAHVRGTPHGLKDLAMGHDLASVAREEREQLEF